VPPLALAEPAPLRVGRQDFELGKACLMGGDIALCAAAQRRGEEVTANYSLRALPLQVIAAVAAPESSVVLEGKLEGGGDLRRTSDGHVSGRATLTSPAGAFAENKGEDAIRMEYREFGIDVDLASDVTQARVRAILPRQGDLAGSITLTPTGKETALGGSAGLKLRDLAPLGLWLPQLANLRGSGELGAEFAGTLAAPQISLTVRGTGLDAEVPLLGLHLREGNMSATLAPGGSFDAQGSIASGEGALKLSGARNADGLALKFQGDNFLAANVPGARVAIAPDLALSGKLSDLLLSGSVTIQNAEVNLEKLNFGKSSKASSDVVVVDRDQEGGAHSLGLRTDVRIILGDQVKLDGFGLDAKVAGELRVQEEREQPSRATGEIRVDGTYEAFGRKLTIERGRLQFAGTALDDPQLDILATRKLQDITAKLRVSGTAQHPKLDVFTDPAMSQTDAMAYLLTGKPASDLHGEDGATVQNAAQSVGSVLGNRIAKKLGGKMGFVDQVGVEQNADLGGSAFTVGKYLSPKLFVSYGVGLFEPGSAITVRYEFSDRWSLEANDSPEDQHAGIRYRIEK
jgi:translocation and assembly module TamB